MDLLLLGVEAKTSREDVLVAEASVQDVLDGGEAVDQVVVLEDHRDLAVHRAKLPTREVRDVLPAEGDGAVGGLDEAVDAAQEGGLAGAGGADDADEAPLGNLEGDVVERRLDGVRVRERDVVKPNYRGRILGHVSLSVLTKVTGSFVMTLSH